MCDKSNANSITQHVTMFVQPAYEFSRQSRVGLTDNFISKRRLWISSTSLSLFSANSVSNNWAGFSENRFSLSQQSSSSWFIDFPEINNWHQWITRFFESIKFILKIYIYPNKTLSSWEYVIYELIHTFIHNFLKSGTSY